MPDHRPEYHSLNLAREAFLHPLNLGYLLLVSLGALMVSGTPWMPTLVLTIGIGVELLYLGTVPHQPWFRRYIIERLDARDQDGAGTEKRMFDELQVHSQKKFLILKRLCDKIDANFRSMPGSARLLAEPLVSRIESLMSEYLRQLVFHERFSELLRQSSTGALILEIRSLELELKAEYSGQLREVRTRRLEILKKRLEKLKSAEERVDICTTRQETIEDAVRYVYEKTMTIYHPDDFGSQLDEMMAELEDTSAYIRQLEEDAAMLSRYDRYMNS
ncbi:hypothetical protein QA596_01260 [Balneolales bacterium ANBcel1]|nr:hypothetical protein [Balneolales bacterium ANBcel1]